MKPSASNTSSPKTPSSWRIAFNKWKVNPLKQQLIDVVFIFLNFAEEIRAIEAQTKQKKEAFEEFKKKKQIEITDIRKKAENLTKKHLKNKEKCKELEASIQQMRDSRKVKSEGVAIYEPLFKQLGVNLDSRTCPG